MKTLQDIVGRLKKYCEGYNFQGLSYINAITLHATQTKIKFLKDTPKYLQLRKILELNAFDLAEAVGAYLGEMNMITASSFSSPLAYIWGLDLAKHVDYYENKDNLYLFTEGECRVYNAEPLIEAATALFGKREEKHFPIYPGSHVLCVNSFYYSKPNDKYVVTGVAVGIPKEKDKHAKLFMQFSNGIKSEAKNIKDIKEEVLRYLAKSVLEVGINQKITYEEIFVDAKVVRVKPDKPACAFTAVPYILLAQDAATEKPDNLQKFTLQEWIDVVRDDFLCNSH